MLKTVLTLIAILLNFSFNSQKIIFEDYFNGGVTGTGLNIGIGGYSPDPLIDFLSLHLEEGSSIRKAYLLTTYSNFPKHNTLNFNGVDIDLSILNDQNDNFTLTGSSGSPIRVLNSDLTDITTLFTISDTTISLITPSSIPFNANPAITGFYFLILYENSNLPVTNISIIKNISDSSPTINYELSGLNPMNLSNHIGLSINASNCCNLSSNDGTKIYVNNMYSGIIGDNDPLSIAFLGCGSIGNFYYQNNTFYGLSDDTPDTLFYASDAIANIQPFLNSNSSLDIKYQYQDSVDLIGPFAAYSNTIWQTFLTYSTPCDTFSASVIENQEICFGESVQLTAEGGVSYEWLPQEGLSCYDCPNPVFTDTTSHWYTVKINNNDSCHKILPVYVRVSAPPDIPFYVIDSVWCSDSTSGSLTIIDTKPNFSYSLDDLLPDQDSVFNHLSAQEYVLEITSNYGCKSDTTISINTINPTEAIFSASPSEGEIPLTVVFDNASLNATDYIWHIEDDTLYSVSPTYIFTESGEFPVTLTAFDTYPWCSDTMQFVIITEPSFNLIIPSTYDITGLPYQIFTTDVYILDYTLYNISGQQIYHKKLFPENGSLSLWQKNLLATGIYLYRIKAVSERGEEKILEGKILVY